MHYWYISEIYMKENKELMGMQLHNYQKKRKEKRKPNRNSKTL